MKRFFCIAGIGVGVALIIVGIYMMTGVGEGFFYSKTEDYKFGADFYTEQYAATRNASDNIVAVGKLISRTFETGMQVMGGVVLIFGMGIICYFGCIITENKESAKRDNHYAYLGNTGIITNGGMAGVPSSPGQGNTTIAEEYINS